MSNWYKLIMICSIAALWQQSAQAQQITPSAFNISGGYYNAPASYYRFEWSIGELTLIDTYVLPDNTLSVAQGILQPCTDKITPRVSVWFFTSDDYRAFPNPTSGRFEVDFFIRQPGHMDIKVTDATGRLLEQRSYQYNGCCHIEHFDFSRYEDGVYIIIPRFIPYATGPAQASGMIRQSGIKVTKAAGR